ncbi:hypothetical protein J1614_009697 [Plenodomus biglobosus]|nr:hypothetical protein J1614_009697 [Plenodomus biglobosus]
MEAPPTFGSCAPRSMAYRRQIIARISDFGDFKRHWTLPAVWSIEYDHRYRQFASILGSGREICKERY